MLQLLLGKQPWFERREGALFVRPIRWQAYVLIASFLFGLIGVGLLAGRKQLFTGAEIGMIVTITSAFILITMRRTASRA